MEGSAQKIRDIDRELRKDLLVRSVAVLLMLSAFTITSISAFRRFLSEPPHISFVKGDVKIFVNGIWIPLRAGMSYSALRTAKLKIKGEMWIGEKIKLSAEDAEVELRGTKLTVIKGEAKIKTEKEEKTLREKETLDIGKITGELGEQKVIPDDLIPEEKTALTEREKAEKKELKSKQKEVSELDLRFVKENTFFTHKVRGNIAYIHIRTPARKIRVNRINLYSESGSFFVILPLEEGENEITVEYEREDGKRVVIIREKILADFTPPSIEEKTLEWEF